MSDGWIMTSELETSSRQKMSRLYAASSGDMLNVYVERGKEGRG